MKFYAYCSIFFLSILLFPKLIYAQVFHGQVVDDQTGSPLIGATIQWKESQNGTLTNYHGEYSLTGEADTLLIRYLGYQSRSFYPDSDQRQIIRLQPDTLQTTIPIVRDNRILLETPQPFTILPKSILWQDKGTSIVPALNQVPGVFVHSGALNTNRITLRGIGSRNLFGTAKIRAFIDGIPLTDGSGETLLENIDLSLLEQVTVWKGPSASHLGASLGGVIQLQTKTLQNDANSQINNTLTIGSFGLTRNVIQSRFQSKDNRTSIAVNHNITHSDGYRDNNQYDRQSFNILARLEPGDGHQMTILGSYTDLKAFIPSSLNLTDFQNEPTKAAFTWGQVMGFEDVEQTLFGLNHRFIKNRWQVSSNLFTTWRENYELRPFGILNEASRAIGIRSSGTYFHSDLLKISLGGEIYRERYNGATYEQVDRAIGQQESDQEQVRTYFNFFSEIKGSMNQWHWEAGVNLNETRYNLQDLFVADNIDQSGTYSFDWTLSPRLGLSYVLNQKMTLYALVSHGFSAPNVEETLTPEGLINTDIQPERGWNTELGMRGKTFNHLLQYDIAFYRMSISDLLVARRTGNDQFVGVNAGKTQHQGIEAFLSFQIPQGIQIQASYTFADYEFKEFIDLDQDFSGNPLTGVAPHVFHLMANWQTKHGLYLQARYQFVDEMPLRDDASIYSESYQLFHLQTGYNKSIGEHFSFQTAFGLNNVFNKNHASMVLINAASFGGRAPRYYYPGEERNWYMRIGLKYSW